MNPRIKTYPNKTSTLNVTVETQPRDKQTYGRGNIRVFHAYRDHDHYFNICTVKPDSCRVTGAII